MLYKRVQVPKPKCSVHTQQLQELNLYAIALSSIQWVFSSTIVGLNRIMQEVLATYSI